jgi:hypothetical protein
MEPNFYSTGKLWKLTGGRLNPRACGEPMLGMEPTFIHWQSVEADWLPDLNHGRGVWKPNVRNGESFYPLANVEADWLPDLNHGRVEAEH